MKKKTIRFIITSHFKEIYNNKVHFKELCVFKPKLIHAFTTNSFKKKKFINNLK